MADKRINALANTAPNTASDDFIAIDGTTNGTRKLNAFSPTFGGNATVTGTLSSGGNLSVTSTSAQIILGQSSGSQLTYLIRPSQAGGAIQMVQDSATANRWLSLGISDNLGVYSELMRVAGATGNILIPGTVASTTTSSGALVVGNGTSGGLGVGGSINAGGNVTISGSNGYAVIGGRQWSFRANSSGGSPASGCVIRDDSAAVDRLTIDINGNTTVGGTLTSTTSTDSGVLQLNLVNSSTGTSASSLFRFNAGTRTATLQAYNDTHATLAGQLRVATSNGDIVLVPSGVASATFGASSTTFGSTVNVSVGSGTAATLGLNQTGVANAYLTQKATSGDLALGNGGGDQLTIAKATGVVSITSSAISSNTSSGALVVSGGVGVAGSIYAGGDIAIPADKGIYIKQGNVQKWTSDGTPTGTSRADIYADSGGAFFVRTGGATQALTISSSQNATFAGSIAINNTVTTGVSVVSTHKVQISIGGTTYYLLASNV